MTQKQYETTTWQLELIKRYLELALKCQENICVDTSPQKIKERNNNAQYCIHKALRLEKDLVDDLDRGVREKERQERRLHRQIRGENRGN